MEQVRLIFNKIRVWFLRRFTNRVKEIVVKDATTGQEMKATSIQSEERVCDHKNIEEIAPTLYQCTGCKDVYFMIMYKVMASRSELINYTERIADHFDTKLAEKDA